MHKNRDTLIKKYPNRRLYNTATSTYVKLQDLADLVKTDQDFKVIDAKTEEDLTKQTLAQIVMDQELKYYDAMPAELIKMVIKLYNNPMSDAFEKFANESVSVFEKNFNNSNLLDSYTEFNKDMQKIAQDNIQFFQNLFKIK